MSQLEAKVFLDALNGGRRLVEAPVDVGERWPVVRWGGRPPVNRVTRRLVYKRDDYRCQFCEVVGLMELDHIIPWSAGGPDTSENFRCLCRKCNEDRSNYRTALDSPAIPVTLACDNCIQGWVRIHGFSRYGRCLAGPGVEAYCGNCEEHSYVTDPRRLR
jgi:hypothetical protein